ncbi:pirin family protein [Streptomyces sp. HNM0663]|uniref:Pirin family protein n=1 Tax=Streptomyces chengmaiensis TaxID=3040919 RepID=A0ABT6HP03_9ACTN|nr:pirin family protein [Streptomyces chengmaiensis]MDH2389629.1 pirin family protein [Streptomyces chengmaiensis]
MPAVTVDDLLLLKRVRRPDPALTAERRVRGVITAEPGFEGAGFPIRRAFPGPIAPRHTDPFLMLDHVGAVDYAPGDAKGAPWHPHRGFETVSYVLDGAVAHQDSNGGGGIIEGGDTQWMTAGSGILHDEMPTEEMLARGGVMHSFQLWVNLPAADKWNPPRYQDIRGDKLTLLSSADGGALIRLIAGELDGHRGPGATATPIILVHATLSPGARLELPWPAGFNALAYAFGGQGTAGPENRGLREGQLALFGEEGGALGVTAAARQEGPADDFDLLIFGGRPIREPIARYGPFVMNTRDEIAQAVEDYRSGRLGTVPAEHADVPDGGGAPTAD